MNMTIKKLFKYGIGLDKFPINRIPNKNATPNPNIFLNNTKDSKSISLGAEKYLKSEQFIKSLTSFKGLEIKPIRAKNNTLEINNGEYYSYPNKNGANFIMSRSISKGGFSFPLELFEQEHKIKSQDISDNYWNKIYEVEKYFTFLTSDATGYLVNCEFERKESKEFLQSIGVEPGWFKIKSDGQELDFYVDDDYFLWPKKQIDSQILGMNTCNYFNPTLNSKEGIKPYSMDSIFLIDGKEYRLNENGRLNIPPDVVAISSKIKITR